jgi:hypothetical protein
MSTMLTAYDPPAYMTDFDKIPGQLARWSRAVSGWFDESIAAQAGVLRGQPCQYYNQLTTPPVGPTLEQEIVWNAFSGTLRKRWGRVRALAIAEQLIPLTQRIDGPGSYHVGGQWNDLYYRPQDEYCEWRVTQDPDGGIRRVTFTAEPPEYWQAMHGDTLASIDGVPTYPTVGDPDLLVELYQEYVSPQVRCEDLVCAVDLVDYSDPDAPTVVYAKGTYNPYNRWNTVDGIMHLNQPANTLGAEIRLGADATILRSPKGSEGRRISDPDALICCAKYGGANRCSDPTIGASVNELASMGLAITLRNPVGLYIDNLNVAGWATPDGKPVDPGWFQILRGSPGLIERAVFEVPDRLGFRVSDLTIGGESITVGGQLAEHITVKLVGLASERGKYCNIPAPCDSGCCADAANPLFVYFQPLGMPCPPGRVPAFDHPVPHHSPVAGTYGDRQPTSTAADRPARRAPHRSR